MIKRYAINKITVSTMCLILLLMFYMLPTNNKIDTVINENENKKENVLYMLDDDNYVSKVISYYDEKSIIENIKKKINILTYGDESLNNFYSLIPKNTRLNSIKVDKDNVYLDFSKELMEISEYLEEEMIESIIYSLTEINGINNIYISVDGAKLNKLPNSDKELPYPLTRKYGINKEYNINSLNDITKTTIIFSKIDNNYKYFVPITKVSNISEDKIDIIIEELKSGVNAQNNLNGYISEKVSLEKYEITDDKINLVFNDYIFSDDSKKVILEEVKYAISESIFENYDVNEVIFSTKNQNKVASVSKK